MKKNPKKRLFFKHSNRCNPLNNSFDLVQNLKDIQVDDDYILISLDVVSLFTNICIDLAIESVSKRRQFLDKV